MKPESSAWNAFFQSGKIDDYLDYCNSCHTHEHQLYRSVTKGAEPANATDNQRNCPPGLQN